MCERERRVGGKGRREPGCQMSDMTEHGRYAVGGRGHVQDPDLKRHRSPQKRAFLSTKMVRREGGTHFGVFRGLFIFNESDKKGPFTHE
jgi:hypothetical protein